VIGRGGGVTRSRRRAACVRPRAGRGGTSLLLGPLSPFSTIRPSGLHVAEGKSKGGRDMRRFDRSVRGGSVSPTRGNRCAGRRTRRERRRSAYDTKP